MHPSHENVNIDMLIDRIVNRMMDANSKELPSEERVGEMLALVAPNDGCLGSLNSLEYVRDRFGKYRQNMALLEELIKIPIIEQKSEEWHRVRQTITTASDFAQALGEGKFGTQSEFLHKKAGYKDMPFDADCPPLKWGVMFEDVACAIYEKRENIKVLPFGLIKHPSVDHFGASPDGITTLGIMVEIKCPFKRKITNEVPKQYYYQIQGQLDVCGLDECDFLECEFKKVPDVQELKGMQDHREIGCIFELKDGSYVYSPIFSSDDAGHAGLVEWITCNKKIQGNENIKEQNTWFLDVINVIRVYKDPDFIERKMKELEVVWGKVMAYRGSKDLYDVEIGDKSEKALKKTARGINNSVIKTSAAGFVTLTGYGFLDDDAI